MASVRRHGRRAVAFNGVRPALAGHGPRRQVAQPPGRPCSCCPVPASAGRRASRPSLAVEWAIRSW